MTNDNNNQKKGGILKSYFATVERLALFLAKRFSKEEPDDERKRKAYLAAVNAKKGLFKVLIHIVVIMLVLAVLSIVAAPILG